MEKQLRQFAPFLALIVAALLVVIANPADTGGGADDADVAGISERRATTTVPAAADVPAASDAPADAEPFAPADAGSSTPSFTAPSFSSSSSSSSSSGSSSSGFTTPTSSVPTTFAPVTTSPPFDDGTATTTTTTPAPDDTSDFYLFDAMASSAACSAGGGERQIELATGYQASLHSSEPSYPDMPGGMTPNRTDPEAERYFYRAHGLMTNAAVSVTDTSNGATRILAQRPDWERMDGVVWATLTRTLFVAENMKVSEQKDAAAPAAKGGHVYEINPVTGVPTLRAALGSKAHKGMSFDHLGNLYSVSASSPGYVYRFVPKGVGANLYSTGDLSALHIHPNGEANWLLLSGAAAPNAAALNDTDEAARVAGATPFLSPEDAEVMIITAASGAKRSQLFVAEQGANRVVTVVLRGTDNTAFAAVYAAPGENAPLDFAAPSKIAIDVTYNVYISERNGGDSNSSKTLGDDIWVAPANPASAVFALPLGRLGSITDCDAEPAGLTFDLTTTKLFVNLKHRGGDGRDMTMLITKSGGN